MDEYDFTHEMSPEQVRLAKAAGRLARKQASGSTLYDALTVGEALLVGRAVAMSVVRTNVPNGKQYAHAFAAWKTQFGFTAGKGEPLPQQYLDNCILCAAHRTLADEIIAKLSPTQRAGLGISGLAARVRKEISPPKEPRMTPARQVMDQLGVLTDIASFNKSASEILRRCGLAIDESNLIIIDGEKFTAWLDAQHPKLLGSTR